MNPLSTLFALLVVSVSPAWADTLKESYTAVLSEQDHFSSRGVRLTEAAAVIRQDRVNFHKFGKRDEGDGGDRFFAKVENREKLEILLKNGTSEPSAMRRIVNETPSVTVRIYERETGGDYVNILVDEVEASGGEDVLLETYTARLSEQDHVNSGGSRLNNPAAIIRQDRANFHKFGKRDEGDQGDRFFASAANRDRLENLLNRGRISDEARRAIVNGHATVTIQIYKTSGGENYIVVFIQK